MKHAIEWIDKPFAGFLYFDFAAVGAVGSPELPGVQAGLRYMDMILEVNDKKIHSGADINRVVLEAEVGEKLRYTVWRRGRVIHFEIPVTRFTVRHLLTMFPVPFFSGLVFWLIGIVVYFLKRDTLTTWVHLLFCLFVGLYTITGFELQSSSPRWSHYVNLLGLTFTSAAGLHLSLIFPVQSRIISRFKFIPLVLYGMASTLYVIDSLLFHHIVTANVEGPELIYAASALQQSLYFSRILMLLTAVAIMASSAHAYFTSESTIAKQRARIILLSSGVAFIPPTLLLTAAAIGKSTAPSNFAALTLPIFPAALGYAIARHNLFDVDVFIKRTVGYILMTIIVGTAYFGIQVGLRKWVLDPLLGAQADNAYPIIFALFVVFFFNPVNRKVQENVDKLFFRKQYDYKAALAKVTDALSMTTDVRDIIHSTVGLLRKEMFVDSAGVVLLDDRKRECRSLFIMDGQGKGQEESKDLCLDYEDPLLALLAKEKKLITKYDVAEDPQYDAVRESCGQRFEAMGASLALPLFSHDHVTGVLALGYKKSGHFYNREDIDLLKTVSSMASTAIEQAREKGEKQMVMQLFSKHVSPEVAEAVWNEREQFLEGGRPKSQKLTVTVLFTDLKGFSTVSERMDPQSLMDWLNAYMEKMAKVVMDHGGIVDDYYGDAIKANFGVPLLRMTEDEIRKDALHAVSCALAMEQEMVPLNIQMENAGLPVLKMRVGIYTGPVVAGSLGSADRLKYTTIGDTVNTASRLESFDKDLAIVSLGTRPLRILIGNSTHQLVKDEFITERVGELELRGKSNKVTVYCVIENKNSPLSSTVQRVSTSI